MFKSYFKLIKNIFSIFGLIVFILLLLLLFFGETSKERRDIFFNTLKSFAGVGYKYDGFIANTPSKYANYIYLTITNKFVSHNFDSLHLAINTKNLKSLEKQRTNKYHEKNYKKKWVKGKVTILNHNKKINKSIKVKLRAKGDRKIHFLNLNSMSYKIDVVGKDDFVFGMEEMSLQKPVARNFAWEILYHELLKKQNIVSLNIIPVKFYRNNKYLGIFVLEESFGNELLKRQSREPGPIIGINEELDHSFPNLTYEFYSEKYWNSKNKKILKKAKNKLNYIKSNYKKNDFNVYDYFDLDKWAKYFALSDVLKMFHGTVTKSVKLYYNPSSGLFEPIAFDGHYQSGYQDFSFIDFINDPKIDCGYACSFRSWYSLFFNNKNTKFLEKYFEYMTFYTSDKYQNMIVNFSKKKIDEINNFFYSEYQSSDRVFFKGVLPYYFDISIVKKRSDILKQKILRHSL